MEIVKNLGIILADTGRSNIYLSLLIEKGMCPDKIVFLRNDSESLPGQLKQQGSVQSILGHEVDTTTSVAEKISMLESEIVISPTLDINSREFVLFLEDLAQEYWIYSGYGGVILREDILALNKKFLHVHGGYLPDYKGSTCNFYSSLEKEFFGASAIFLDREIDAGPLLMRKKFPVPASQLDFDYIYESVCRGDVLVSTLEYFLKNRVWPEVDADQSAGRTFYIIHPLLKHVVLDRFEGEV